MNIIRCISIFVLLGLHLMLIGQGSSFKFDFNDCTGESTDANVPGLTFLGSPQCICGPKGMTYQLDGLNQSLSMSPIINPKFNDDFTLDFYFSNLGASGESHLLYVGTCVNVDSLMRLRYFSDKDEYLFELSGSINNFFSTKFKVDNSKCWHRFTLVKFKLEYFMYIDSKLAYKFLAKETIVFPKNVGFSFGHNPCSGVSGSNFRGSFDEITFFNSAQSEQEVVTSDIYAERIETLPITIFKGETVSLTIGEYCGNITWSPSISLDNTTSKEVKASPEETTIYSALINSGSCVSNDSVIVYVADKEKLDCSKLLLPTAFTPNGDGRNDLFKISNTFIVEDLSFFEVYARNGAKVWETNDLNQGWDGMFNGALQLGGTYLYKIKYVCNSQEYISTKAFVLIR